MFHFFNLCFAMIASLATTNSQKSSMNSFAAKTFCSLITCSTYKMNKTNYLVMKIHNHILCGKYNYT